MGFPGDGHLIMSAGFFLLAIAPFVPGPALADVLPGPGAAGEADPAPVIASDLVERPEFYVDDEALEWRVPGAYETSPATRPGWGRK